MQTFINILSSLLLLSVVSFSQTPTKKSTETNTTKWVVDGHVLPPEPDPVLNNATLLGIDVNNNGVRDDVERWIYETYKDKHPIHIAMQAARAYKQVLETSERAKEIQKSVNAPLYCSWYYQYDVEDLGRKILVQERIDAPIKSIYFDTNSRSTIYRKYDKLLSGDSYKLPRMKERKALCDFDTSKYDKK